MELLILAAGTGSRLSPHTDHLPKCLLPIDGDVTILDHQLELAQSLGITRIKIVVGYQFEQIEAKLDSFRPYFDDITTVYNPFFETTNNLVSLWLGVSQIEDSFIMMNGDSILNVKILKSCLSNNKGVLIPISRKSSYDADDTKVILDSNDNILQIGKKIEPEHISAEWMGVSFFSKDMIFDLKEIIDQKIKRPALLKSYPHYLCVFNELVERGFKLNTKLFDETFWSEVDYQFDLDDVRSHIRRYRQPN